MIYLRMPQKQGTKQWVLRKLLLNTHCSGYLNFFTIHYSFLLSKIDTRF